ncbi:DNA adenine methylase [Brucella rhizosphaerae]|uniref:DNA adenine methylase n=1 Tax=Brucella rhizosphaerae TaxID=571254 RepID=UPI000466F099|nr:DNA adenine methylase [Brucella rhizosphaerae]
MGVNISYMGTKREIAPAVVDVIDSTRPGIALDLFAGMCSVGEALSAVRQVWTNDVQKFAYEVATAVFTDKGAPDDRLVVSDRHFPIFETEKNTIAKFFQRSLSIESELLLCEDFQEFELKYLEFKNSFQEELGNFSRKKYSLFTSIYGDSYFGLRQAIEIDAVIATIHGANVQSNEARWLRIALGRAMLRVANSTGHFAQFLKPKASSFRTFIRQRRRSVWEELLNAVEEMYPVGTRDWRRRNKSFNLDCLQLVPALLDYNERPSVIYADPPYTDDQYSRFYHLLETLILYDYPIVSGAGLYRPDRFRTPFSLRTEAASALETLVSQVASTGADMVLSYPTNGLVYEVGSDPLYIMRRHYRSVERCYAISHEHSTFGASKGQAKSTVVEQIFLGQL